MFGGPTLAPQPDGAGAEDVDPSRSRISSSTSRRLASPVLRMRGSAHEGDLVKLGGDSRRVGSPATSGPSFMRQGPSMTADPAKVQFFECEVAIALDRSSVATSMMANDDGGGRGRGDPLPKSRRPTKIVVLIRREDGRSRDSLALTMKERVDA